MSPEILQILLLVFMFVVFYFLLIRPQQHQEAQTRGDGVRALQGTAPETTRIAVGQAILGNFVFRRDVIRRARDPHRAVAPELGLDFELVLQVCLWMDARAQRYEQLFVCGILLGGTFGIVFTPTAGYSMGLLWTLVVAMKESYERKFVLAQGLEQGRFDAREIRSRFPIDIPSELLASIPSTEQNVLAYSGFDPFAHAGIQVSRWSVVVDTTKAKQTPDRALQSEPEPVEISELEAELEDNLARLRPIAARSRDYIVVHGANVSAVHSLLASPLARPAQNLTAEDIAKLDLNAQARRYKWIQVFGWSNELVVSTMLHLERIGTNLFVDAVSYVLTPIAAAYRSIDQLPRLTPRTLRRWVLRSFASAPLDGLVATLCFAARLVETIWWRLFGESRQRHRILDERFFNYGSEQGLRRRLAGTVYTHYFQKIDQERLNQLVNKRVLDTLLGFLDERGIDTSELKDQQSVIINSGVIVHGGDFNAKNVAVGNRAHASGVFARIRGTANNERVQNVGGVNDR